MNRDQTPWTKNGHDDPRGSQGPPAPVPDPARARPVGTPELARAWNELVRVHDLEQARLLRDACRLKQGCDRDAFGPSACAPPARGPDGGAPSARGPDGGAPSARGQVRRVDAELRLASWRRRAEEALELALVDGLEPPALLRFAAAHAIRRWPAALELARASLALEDCAFGRKLLR